MFFVGWFLLNDFRGLILNDCLKDFWDVCHVWCLLRGFAVTLTC